MPLAKPLQQIQRTFVLNRGRKLIYFSGCDYFRLSSHPDVLKALHEGADKFGVNVAASRSTTGNHALFGKLEKRLAKFFGVERAALFSNGYATNLAFVQTFAEEFTHVLIDERAHGSLRDAAEFLKCAVHTFRHRDTTGFSRTLKSLGRNAKPLVLTDGMFSHDGSLAPLYNYLDALPPHAVLLVDDAHGAGVLGKTGKGTPEVSEVRDARLVQTVSLSKAFGVYGGAVLASAKIIAAIEERSRIFNGNTPLPLPMANAVLTSLKILQSNPALRARLHANTARIKKALMAAKVPIADNASPVISITPGNDAHSSRMTRALLRAGIFPSLIRYAGFPQGFRFTISSEHTASQIDKLAGVLIKNAT